SSSSCHRSGWVSSFCRSSCMIWLRSATGRKPPLGPWGPGLLAVGWMVRAGRPPSLRRDGPNHRRPARRGRPGRGVDQPVEKDLRELLGDLLGAEPSLGIIPAVHPVAGTQDGQGGEGAVGGPEGPLLSRLLDELLQEMAVPLGRLFDPPARSRLQGPGLADEDGKAL